MYFVNSNVLVGGTTRLENNRARQGGEIERLEKHVFLYIIVTKLTRPGAAAGAAAGVSDFTLLFSSACRARANCAHGHLVARIHMCDIRHGR